MGEKTPEAPLAMAMLPIFLTLKNKPLNYLKSKPHYAMVVLRSLERT